MPYLTVVFEPLFLFRLIELLIISINAFIMLLIANELLIYLFSIICAFEIISKFSVSNLLFHIADANSEINCKILVYLAGILDRHTQRRKRIWFYFYLRQRNWHISSSLARVCYSKLISKRYITLCIHIADNAAKVTCHTEWWMQVETCHIHAPELKYPRCKLDFSMWKYLNFIQNLNATLLFSILII